MLLVIKQSYANACSLSRLFFDVMESTIFLSNWSAIYVIQGFTSASINSTGETVVLGCYNGFHTLK